MRTIDEYRVNAERCRALAKLAVNLEEKTVLEELARAWERLVELRQDDIEPDEGSADGNGQTI
jgi:hypothetical protein